MSLPIKKEMRHFAHRCINAGIHRRLYMLLLDIAHAGSTTQYILILCRINLNAVRISNSIGELNHTLIVLLSS